MWRLIMTQHMYTYSLHKIHAWNWYTFLSLAVTYWCSVKMVLWRLTMFFVTRFYNKIVLWFNIWLSHIFVDISFVKLVLFVESYCLSIYSYLSIFTDIIKENIKFYVDFDYLLLSTWIHVQFFSSILLITDALG